MRATVRAVLFPQKDFDITPEIMGKIEQLLAAVRIAKKVEVDTDKYRITAWTFDAGDGKLSIGIQIKEV